MTISTRDPIRIGELFSETGVTSAKEASQRLGTLLAINAISAADGIGGRELQRASRDPQSKPSLYRAHAEQLVREEALPLHPRIGLADATRRFEILEPSHHRVRPDPYLVFHTLSDGAVSTALHSTPEPKAIRPVSGTSRLLRDLRSLSVVVLHPDDGHGQELIGQLRRIGCQVKAFGPPCDRLEESVELAFYAVRRELAS